MRIKEKVWGQIVFQLPSEVMESGGVLGGREGEVLYCAFDSGIEGGTASDTYVPNTGLLNSTLREWAQKEIEFYGIFHSHISGNEALSQGDIRYIERIMKVWPENSGSLYFPVVLPGKKIIVYRADKEGECIRIVSEGIELS